MELSRLESDVHVRPVVVRVCELVASEGFLPPVTESIQTSTPSYNSSITTVLYLKAVVHLDRVYTASIYPSFVVLVMYRTWLHYRATALHNRPGPSTHTPS